MDLNKKWSCLKRLLMFRRVECIRFSSGTYTNMHCWHVPDSEKSHILLKEFNAHSFINKIERQSSNKRYSKSDKIPSENHQYELQKYIRWLKGQRYSPKNL